MKQQILWVVEMHVRDNIWIAYGIRKTRAEAREFCAGFGGLRVAKYIRSE